MNRREHLLTILAEECAEIAQEVSKALRFGLDDCAPGTDVTNERRIAVELVELCATVEMLRKMGNIPVPPDFEEIAASKQARIEEFLRYSEQRGTLNG